MHVGNCTDDSTYYIASGAPGGDDDDKIVKEVPAGCYDRAPELKEPIAVTFFADPNAEQPIATIYGLENNDIALLVQCGTERNAMGLAPVGSGPFGGEVSKA